MPKGYAGIILQHSEYHSFIGFHLAFKMIQLAPNPQQQIRTDGVQQLLSFFMNAAYGVFGGKQLDLYISLVFFVKAFLYQRKRKPWIKLHFSL